MRPLYQRADFPSYRMNRKSCGSKVIYSSKPKWVEALGFVLGACLKQFELELHAACFNYNHDHMCAGHPWHDDATTAPRFAAFNQRFRFLWWLVLKANENWEGPAYTRKERTDQGAVLDAEEYWRVATYDTAQAIKVGLFQRTKDDPSLVFLPEDVLEPRVFRRNSIIDKVDPDRVLFPFDEVSIQLGVPRIFSHLTREEYAKEFANQLEAYEDEVGPKRVYSVESTKNRCHKLRIGQPVGRDTHKTRGRRRRNAPQTRRPVYTSKPELRKAYRDEESAFFAAHQTSYEDMKKHGRAVVFPTGTSGWRRLMNVPVSPPPTTCWANQPLWWPD